MSSTLHSTARTTECLASSSHAGAKVRADGLLVPEIRYYVLHDTERPFDPDLVPLAEGYFAECEAYVRENPKTKLWFDMPDLRRFSSLARH
jgi:hypothetical protein